jgi:predicted kinase
MTETILRRLIKETLTSKRKLYVLVGPPGVGKSTWIKHNVNDPYVISRDNIVDDRRRQLGLKYDDMFADIMKDVNKEINKELADRAALAASSGQDIVVDMTNTSPGARRGALNAVKGAEDQFEKIAVVFDVRGKEDLVRRSIEMRSNELQDKHIPKNVVDSMLKSFSENIPTKEEGFDEIIFVDATAALMRK